MVMQRTATPFTPVRFRPQPPPCERSILDDETYIPSPEESSAFLIRGPYIIRRTLRKLKASLIFSSGV